MKNNSAFHETQKAKLSSAYTHDVGKLFFNEIKFSC